MLKRIMDNLKGISKKQAVTASITAFAVVAGLLTLAACAGAVRADSQPQFRVVALGINPSTVGAGEQTVVTASIVNNGVSDGQYSAVLSVNDATQEIAGVNVPAGGTQTIQFSLSKNTPQIYKVSVGEQTALLQVTAQQQNGVPGVASASNNLPPCCQTGATANQPAVTTPTGTASCCQPGATSQGTVAPRRSCCQ